ncbi:unnamed protein product [Vitrella brassicaformis CCMP3155]|uniref:Uncharacterized protein n=1 Tax=Vitrella brassicaformis (strain CCMP3155) TaxID=1169540 RepID=A0A0G4ELG7_VITBC|nr:unnamed protein product [Vitrella brassicaformis CCMP3155]|mmetsp:Transcript_20209/g.49049  ORF Transcript_20209/g.49049 Transcript_20209/m.49049 type:complete len:216 (-) Transcript_20209:1047-1694(-)|eukprot:CEL98258.1 unnamed protein product [Vitrella brassicaformis CCMP3155]
MEPQREVTQADRASCDAVICWQCSGKNGKTTYCVHCGNFLFVRPGEAIDASPSISGRVGPSLLPRGTSAAAVKTAPSLGHGSMRLVCLGDFNTAANYKSSRERAKKRAHTHFSPPPPPPVPIPTCTFIHEEDSSECESDDDIEMGLALFRANANIPPAACRQHAKHHHIAGAGRNRERERVKKVRGKGRERERGARVRAGGGGGVVVHHDKTCML